MLYCETLLLTHKTLTILNVRNLKHDGRSNRFTQTPKPLPSYRRNPRHSFIRCIKNPHYVPCKPQRNHDKRIHRTFAANKSARSIRRKRQKHLQNQRKRPPISEELQTNPANTDQRQRYRTEHQRRTIHVLGGKDTVSPHALSNHANILLSKNSLSSYSAFIGLAVETVLSET